MMRATKRQIRRLERILSTQSESRNQTRMVSLAGRMMREMGMHVTYRDGMAFGTKGDPEVIRPFFIAHADTVHKIAPDDRYAISTYDDRGRTVYYAYDPTTNMQRGVGGDDKCGIFVAIEAARSLPNASVIITRDEEIGCIGARLIESHDIEKASALIQADRRGNTDAVRHGGGTPLSSAEWQWHVDDILHEHGFTWTDAGVMTDVFELHWTGAASVSAINLSAGYWHPHTDREVIVLEQLMNTLSLAIALGEASGDRYWSHIGGDPWSSRFRGLDGLGEDAEWAYWDSYYAQGRTAPEIKAKTAFRSATGKLIYTPTEGDDAIDAEYEVVDDAEVEMAQYRADAARWRQEWDAAQREMRGPGLDEEFNRLVRQYLGEERPYVPCEEVTCNHEADFYFFETKQWFCEEHFHDAVELRSMIQDGIIHVM